MEAIKTKNEVRIYFIPKNFSDVLYPHSSKSFLVILSSLCTAPVKDLWQLHPQWPLENYMMNIF